MAKIPCVREGLAPDIGGTRAGGFHDDAASGQGRKIFVPKSSSESMT
jgi:hypothetical protein